MSLTKPTFNSLLSHYPTSADDFGAGGSIINNPSYEHTCALRLSVALDGSCPGILSHFTGNQAVHLEGTPGHYTRTTLPYARGALSLARYLKDSYVGWRFRRLSSRSEAIALTTQGIIFWKVIPGSSSPNHIDLWDPVERNLRSTDGRSMLWVPRAGIVEYAWFWEMRPEHVVPPLSLERFSRGRTLPRVNMDETRHLFNPFGWEQTLWFDPTAR